MSQISNNIKTLIKGNLKRIRLNYLRWRYTFNSENLLSALQVLGIEKGDVIMVHSSMSGFESFSGKPTDIITSLQKAIGPEGTLLIPTMPFNGTALEYALSNKVFDVKRTPSRMGMISELFRRMPNVIRSCHPTHSVAAWGRNAEQIIQDHYRCETPCGRHSPFGKLLDYKGKILLLGTGINVLTFFHTVEEILEEQMPFSPFTADKFSLTSKVDSDTTITIETRLFDPNTSKIRNINKIIPYLQKNGCWKETNIGTLNAILLNATDILETLVSMSENGIYCYDK